VAHGDLGTEQECWADATERETDDLAGSNRSASEPEIDLCGIGGYNCGVDGPKVGTRKRPCSPAHPGWFFDAQDQCFESRSDGRERVDPDDSTDAAFEYRDRVYLEVADRNEGATHNFCRAAICATDASGRRVTAQGQQWPDATGADVS